MTSPGTEASMARRPLTAQMIRALGKVPPASKPELPALLTALAEALAAVLRDFTQAPVKVEADGLGIEHHPPPVADAVTSHLVSGRGPLGPSLVADRAFTLGLCEAAFGGTGMEPPFDGEDRPLSKTEQRLTRGVLEALAARLPAALELCLGTVFALDESDRRKQPPPSEHDAEFIAGRLLVHIYGYSGEVRLLLPEVEIGAILALGAESVAAHGPASAEAQDHFRAEILEGPVDLSVQVPQELMQLGEVARLRKGQLLKFKATVETPLLVSCEGLTLHRARLSSSEGHVTLEIVAG